MAMMPLTDSAFLLVESREHPMHVGGLQLFQPPAGADPSYVSDLHRQLLTMDDVRPLFRRRPRGQVSSLGQWVWSSDSDLDLEYHVRLSALPRPGRVRELLELTSRLHGSLLDRHRPLWEFYLIEGLSDGRFAVYTKFHHALLDGVSALRLLDTTLSSDPNAIGLRAPWSPIAPIAQPRQDQRATEAGAHGADPATGAMPGPLPRFRAAASVVGELAGLLPALMKIANQVLREQAGALPFQAPRSMLNVPITGARRFAAQSYSLERITAVRKAAGVTLNDVVLAMCAGALRQYLLDLGALPDRSLVTAVPVSLRGADRGASAESDGGNAVGIILCPLATDLADPAARLAAIRTSMQHGKRMYAGLSSLQVTAISALAMAPIALSPIPGVMRLGPPPFNLIISNVPGPRRPLYWNRARLQSVYPVSIPYEGQALNITVTSYNGSLNVGLTGCRRSVPSLQRMLVHLETALADLEKAVT
jgi:diacylglycerol O-acyltransferase / wax synthase